MAPSGTSSGRVRMAVIPGFKATTLTTFIKQEVAPGSTIYADGLKQFAGLPVAGFRRVPRTQPLRRALRKSAQSVVPLADRAIDNLQQWLVGPHHGVSRAHSGYLDEFAFRHNRRRKPTAAWQTLLGLGAGRAPTPYQRILRAQDGPGNGCSQHVGVS
jgi:transposase-like protein